MRYKKYVTAADFLSPEAGSIPKSGFYESDFDVPIEDVISSYNSYYAEVVAAMPRFEAVQAEFINRLHQIADPLGFEVADPKAKSIKSSVNKLMRKNFFEGRQYCLPDFKDNVRATILMNSLDDIAKLTGLKDVFSTIRVEYKHNSVSGYLGFHITTEINGVKCELQLSTPDMFNIKLESDAIYEAWRNRNIESSEKETDEKRSAALWNGYLEKSGLTPPVLLMASDSLMSLQDRTVSKDRTGRQAPLKNSFEPNAERSGKATTQSSSSTPYITSIGSDTRNTSLSNDNTIIHESETVVKENPSGKPNIRKGDPSLKNNFRAKSRLPSGENPVREVPVPSETTADDGETRTFFSAQRFPNVQALLRNVSYSAIMSICRYGGCFNEKLFQGCRRRCDVRFMRRLCVFAAFGTRR